MHITLCKKLFDIRHTPGLLGWVKRTGMEIVRYLKYNLIDLSDLIGFGYYLSDTQGELECWRMGFIFCGKNLLLLTRIQMSDPGPTGLLVMVFPISMSFWSRSQT